MPHTGQALAGARILVVPNEFPLPATSGGRVDVWRRLQQMRALGAELALLSWYDAPRDGAPQPAALARLHEVCRSEWLTPITRSPAELLQRLLRLGRLPSHAASRWVTLDKPALLGWARGFRPTLLLLDGLYGVAVVRWLSRQLGVPWAYRSHNVEHRYMRQQQRQASSLPQRLGLAANLAGLERVERAAVNEAAAVFDISPDDAAFWQHDTGRDILCWPPVVDELQARRLAAAPVEPAEATRWDAAYFGNLHTPNNVEAVAWWLRKVLPLVEGPQRRFAVIGSRPSALVRELVAGDPRVVLLPDPPDLAEAVSAARVLVNPVQTSSGVNLKSVEMLFTRAALVSTSAGVRGLTPAARECFGVHDDATGFAAAMRAALEAAVPSEALDARAAARRPYTLAGLPDAVLQALADPARSR